MTWRILAFFGLAIVLMTKPVMAEIGLTGNCQDDVRSLQEDMERNKDDYTAKSRARAASEIAAAKTNLVNPVKCRKNLIDAQHELRKGKLDKKKKN
ncbi:MAG: hypothetical protein ACK5PS_18590 [Desulfopila sp.]